MNDGSDGTQGVQHVDTELTMVRLIQHDKQTSDDVVRLGKVDCALKVNDVCVWERGAILFRGLHAVVPLFPLLVAQKGDRLAHHSQSFRVLLRHQ
jgi:hypothetical protein